LPARYEPFGLSILEAALSECALVLGDIPSLRENWEGAAMFVSPDDLPALESALHELIANPERRRDLQKRAGRRARNFDIGKTAEQYVKLYGLLVDRKDSTMARKESCVTI
jgi:glycosyltransferase involved in cell wall biosynthesis